jgi:hypothetical protein
LYWLSFAWLTSLLVALLGLIGLGQWQFDEYVDLTGYRQSAWHHVLYRLQWSPRPISELLLALYGMAVNHTHRQLTGPFLGALWCLFIIAGLFTAFSEDPARHRASRWNKALAGLALLCYFPLQSDSTELFYWPAGAVAYLPTLAASLLLFWQALTGALAAGRGRKIACFCLLVAVGCSEAGAVLAITFAFALFLANLFGAMQKREGRGPLVSSWWWIPGCFAAAILVFVRFNRGSKPEGVIFRNSLTFGHPLASLREGSRQLVGDFLALHVHTIPPAGVHLAPVSLILLAVGVALCCTSAQAKPTASPRHLISLSIAFVAASYFTIVAADWHLGMLCCERHETLRQCWIAMSVAGIGLSVVTRIGRTRLPRWTQFNFVSVLPLLLAFGGIWQHGALWTQYQNYSAIRKEKVANALSGYETGRSSMTMHLPPVGGFLSFQEPPIGDYKRDGSISFPNEILLYYQKQFLAVDPGSLYGESVFPPKPQADN